MAFHGWIWTEGRWRRVCSADTVDKVARLLTRHADAQGVPDTHTVITRSCNAPVGEPLVLGYQVRLLAKVQRLHTNAEQSAAP